MLNINEINKEIERLEHKDYLTYDICQKLATLYIVREYAGTAVSKIEQHIPGTAIK